MRATNMYGHAGGNEHKNAWPGGIIAIGQARWQGNGSKSSSACLLPGRDKDDDPAKMEPEWILPGRIRSSLDRELDGI